MKQKNKEETQEIVKTNKKIKTQQQLQESADKQLLICAILTVIIADLLMSVYSWFAGDDLYNIVKNSVLGICLSLVVSLSYSSNYKLGKLNYDNGYHPFRFFVIFWIGCLAANLFQWIPYTGWMYLFFFIALPIVSNEFVGIIAASVLLIFQFVSNAGYPMSAFLMYLISGFIAQVLFGLVDEEFKTGILVFLSLAFQFLIVFILEILLMNKKVTWEDCLIPAANIIINCILLSFFLQYFGNHVARKFHNQYLAVNDPDSIVLRQLKIDNPKMYKQAINTTYLAERVAADLNLSIQDTKCCAYYYRLDKELLGTIEIPYKSLDMINEIRKGMKYIHTKEVNVVFICDAILTTIEYLRNKSDGTPIQYDVVIRKMFQTKLNPVEFPNSELSLKEFSMIEKRLIEEKMYYDFLR